MLWSNEVVDSGGREREREVGRQSMLMRERERDMARQSISTTLRTDSVIYKYKAHEEKRGGRVRSGEEGDDDGHGERVERAGKSKR